MADIVTFDPIALRIIPINYGSPAVVVLQAREIYSEWKDWLLADPARLGYPPAFTVIGGESFTLTEAAGSTFFLENGWRIRPNEYAHKLQVVGNIVAKDVLTGIADQSVFVPTLGAYNVHTETKVSNLVDQIALGGVDQATVQAALTAQGYTTARAAKVDNLDAAISTIGSAIWSEVVDGTITAAQAMRLLNAIIGSKVSGAQSGIEVFRNVDDTKNRVVVTVDADGNRTDVVYDLD